MSRDPFVKALLMCDTAICDHRTGKWTIVGVFDHWVMPDGISAAMASFSCYGRVGDVGGSINACFRIMDREMKEIASCRMPTAEVNKAGIDYECAAYFNRVILNGLGDYQVQLEINGKLISTNTLKVRSIDSMTAGG